MLQASDGEIHRLLRRQGDHAAQLCLAEAAEQIPNAFQPDENSENNESNEENNEDSSALFDMFGSMMDL